MRQQLCLPTSRVRRNAVSGLWTSLLEAFKLIECRRIFCNYIAYIYLVEIIQYKSNISFDLSVSVKYEPVVEGEYTVVLLVARFSAVGRAVSASYRCVMANQTLQYRQTGITALTEHRAFNLDWSHGRKYTSTTLPQSSTGFSQFGNIWGYTPHSTLTFYWTFRQNLQHKT